MAIKLSEIITFGTFVSCYAEQMVGANIYLVEGNLVCETDVNNFTKEFSDKNGKWKLGQILSANATEITIEAEVGSSPRVTSRRIVATKIANNKGLTPIYNGSAKVQIDRELPKLPLTEAMSLAQAINFYGEDLVGCEVFVEDFIDYNILAESYNVAGKVYSRRTFEAFGNSLTKVGVVMSVNPTVIKFSVLGNKDYNVDYNLPENAKNKIRLVVAEQDVELLPEEEKKEVTTETPSAGGEEYILDIVPEYEVVPQGTKKDESGSTTPSAGTTTTTDENGNKVTTEIYKDPETGIMYEKKTTQKQGAKKNNTLWLGLGALGLFLMLK